MKIALLCSGLGHVLRGHEAFARDLFTLLRNGLDITLFKGGGSAAAGEHVIANVPRDAACLEHVHVAASPKWAEAVREQERVRIEGETFAHAALLPLLEGGYDIVHCLEQEVCNVVYANRHLFQNTPKVLFSNGGAIGAPDLPRCDFVQEHTEHNLARSARDKAFMIPHGVDLERFRHGMASDFRHRHGIPADAFVVIAVGTICFQHKRMDHVIREVAGLADAHLVIVGQRSVDSPVIEALGRQLMGQRIVFTTLPHSELPHAYAAADVFALGSLFETFGIVYVEAMAMGLPVFCTSHANQRSIVKEGVFVDMAARGALTAALRDTPRARLQELGRRGREIAVEHYDLHQLKSRYIERYRAIAAAPSSLPRYSSRTRLAANVRNAVRRSVRLLQGHGG